MASAGPAWAAWGFGRAQWPSSSTLPSWRECSTGRCEAKGRPSAPLLTRVTKGSRASSQSSPARSSSAKARGRYTGSGPPAQADRHQGDQFGIAARARRCHLVQGEAVFEGIVLVQPVELDVAG